MREGSPASCWDPDCVPTGNHAILKPARIGGATPWHQDEAYWDPRYAHRAVSIWLALQPATLENGCMRFIAGSHRGLCCRTS